jgi:hypothetical protein
MRWHALPEQQARDGRAPLPSPPPACGRRQQATNEKTLARWSPRSAPPPWPNRADQAVPLVRRAGLVGLTKRGTEPQPQFAAPRPRSPPPSPPSSFPLRIADSSFALVPRGNLKSANSATRHRFGRFLHAFQLFDRLFHVPLLRQIGNRLQRCHCCCLLL